MQEFIGVRMISVQMYLLRTLNCRAVHVNSCIIASLQPLSVLPLIAARAWLCVFCKQNVFLHEQKSLFCIAWQQKDTWSWIIKHFSESHMKFRACIFFHLDIKMSLLHPQCTSSHFCWDNFYPHPPESLQMTPSGFRTWLSIKPLGGNRIWDLTPQNWPNSLWNKQTNKQTSKQKPISNSETADGSAACQLHLFGHIPPISCNAVLREALLEEKQTAAL